MPERKNFFSEPQKVDFFDDAFFSLPRVYARKIGRRLTRRISLGLRRAKRRALLSYVTHPFAVSREILFTSPHTNPWECLIMADLLVERGFAVDVIDWNDSTFTPSLNYDMVIDVNQNLERLARALPSDTVKIFYITGAHWRYQNEAECKRIAELKSRRGCMVAPRRQMVSSSNIEHADYATALGNGFARDTYAFAGKTITPLSLLSAVMYPFPKNKDFDSVRKNFVWIGGGGAVHKGLDRVLEAFASLPEYRLTVCGPITAEEDFVACYQKELYGNKNITVAGRIDVRGPEFKSIVENAIGLVYPSCSEGQAGSVITALHAGLIPLITYESGVDSEPFGIRINDASPKEISVAVQKMASLPSHELEARSRAAWEYARVHHTIERFKKDYATFIDKVIEEKKL